MAKAVKKVTQKLADDNERGARETVLEDLFNDFNRSRFKVYRMNFIRGIFFGLGSVIGGTVVIALLVWLLSVTGSIIPGVADFVEQIIDVIDTPKN